MARPVDPKSWKPKYIQIVEDLRDRITSGEYQPDAHLESEADLGHIYQVSSLTARRALHVLEAERLISREQGVRARVRLMGERAIVQVQPGDRITIRVATTDERRTLGLGAGVPVAVITKPDGAVSVVPAYDVEFVVTDQGDD